MRYSLFAATECSSIKILQIFHSETECIRGSTKDRSYKGRSAGSRTQHHRRCAFIDKAQNSVDELRSKLVARARNVVVEMIIVRLSSAEEVSGAITPSGTALKIGPGAISTRNTAASGREQTPSRDPKEQADILINTLVNTPSSVIPLSSSYSSFVGYILSSASPHYVAYNVL